MKIISKWMVVMNDNTCLSFKKLKDMAEHFNITPCIMCNIAKGNVYVHTKYNANLKDVNAIFKLNPETMNLELSGYSRLIFDSTKKGEMKAKNKRIQSNKKYYAKRKQKITTADKVNAELDALMAPE